MSFANLTPEQRQANAVKGAATRAANLAKAAGGTAVLERPEEEAQPLHVARKPSMLDQMIARGPQRVHQEADLTGHDAIAGDVKEAKGSVGGVKTTSDTIDMYWLYLNGQARKVPTGSLQVAINNGFSVVCDICGGEHQDETNPNACPGKTPVKGWQCQVCGKIIWGTSEATAVIAATADPNVIVPAPIGDPAVIAQVKGHKHMAVYHPTMAAVYGVDVDRVLAEVQRMPAAV